MTEYFDLWMLLAGLGLFLFGMSHLEAALKELAGKRFRQFLQHSTDRPINSAIGGIVATTILQSSSLVGLIVLAFVGAGIIPLVNAIGIVLGANLGTTFTGWIVATLGFKLDFSTFIYPLLGIGGLGYGVAKGAWKSLSQLVLGFALLLMGLDFMKDSVGMLTEYVDIEVLRGYPLIVFLLVGVVFTAIIQSSSAAMMLTLSALYADIIPLPAAAALVIGADLGTTSTVLLGSLQGAVAKRRLAMAHVLFNVFVDVLAFISLMPLLALIKKLQIEDPLYALVAFHSSFNLFGLLLFLPFVKPFAGFLTQKIKDDSQHIERYIHSVPVDVPEAALKALGQESRYLLFLVASLNMRYLRIDWHQYELAGNEFLLPKTLVSGSKQDHYLAIKKLEGEIVSYALKMQLHETDSHQVDGLLKAIRSAVYSAKSMKDIEQNLAAFYQHDKKNVVGTFQELREQAESVYSEIVSLINADYEGEFLSEELTSVRQLSHDFHHEFAQRIYSSMESVNLSSLDVSTFLNVNKEMQTSEEALIKSLGLL